VSAAPPHDEYLLAGYCKFLAVACRPLQSEEIQMLDQKKRVLFAGFAIVLAMPISQTAQAATHYDLVKDFSIKANPNGVWTYMDSAPLKYASRTYGGVSKLDNWSNDLQGSNFVNILRNETGAPVILDGGNLTLPTNYLYMNSQDNINGVTERFQAPVAGSYEVKGNFMGLDTHQPRSGIYIKLNGKYVFYKRVASGKAKKFRLSLTLAEADDVDFIVPSYTRDKPHDVGLTAKITGP
jgi:hypothetical protein